MMHGTLGQKCLIIAAAAAFAAGATSPAFAQAGRATPAAQTASESMEENLPARWLTDVRGGLGFGATKAGVFGYGWQSPAMGPNKYLRFQPTIFGSFGQHSTITFGVDFDVLLSAKLPASDWSLLVGGGVAIVGAHVGGGGFGGGANTAGGGGDLVIGFSKPSGLFLQTRLVSGRTYGAEVLVGMFLKKGK